jgi:carotenoid 1,2-hydratase
MRDGTDVIATDQPLAFPDFSPGFDREVPSGGYAWWYLDAISDDGVHALTIIAFIGSVFSPYYKWARRRGRGDPLNHCCLNVALYGPRGRWAMTERGRGAVARTATSLRIGPSRLDWDGTTLRVRFDERGMPLPRRVRGEASLTPSAFPGRSFALDSKRSHFWSPLAPIGRIAVVQTAPEQSWSGPAYLDMNWGVVPIETDFIRWNWSCARLRDGAAVLYDCWNRDGTDSSLALRFDRHGGCAPFAPPPRTALPRTGWRLARGTRGAAQMERTLEDTPFYARSLLRGPLLGEDVVSVHESLSLDRFCAPIVQAMLPFRMPRWR